MKKLIITTIIGILLLPAVFARDIGGRIGEMLHDTLGFLFVDYGGHLSGGIEVFYVKFLFWIGLFAALYYPSSKFVFKDANKGVQITVPLAVSLIAIIMIPNNVLDYAVQTYGIIFSIFLLGLPIVGIALLNYYSFKEENATNLFIKAIIMYVLAMMLYNLRAIQSINYLVEMGDIIDFAAGICMISFLFYLFLAILSLFKGNISSSGGGGGFGGGSLWDKITGKTKGTTGTEAQPYPSYLGQYYNKINALVTSMRAVSEGQYMPLMKDVVRNRAGRPAGVGLMTPAQRT